MFKYELSIEREIDFLIKYNLTPDELFLMKLLFFAQNGREDFLSEYFSYNQLTLDLRDTLISLQNKGIINKSYKIPDKGKVLNPTDVDFNKQVINNFYQHSEDLGMDLFLHYPAMININGKTFSLRNITKLYKSMDEMCFAYGKAIKFDPKTHQHVLELLEYGKENNLINSGICDFIESRKWLDLEEMKDKDVGIFETTELL